MEQKVQSTNEGAPISRCTMRTIHSEMSRWKPFLLGNRMSSAYNGAFVCESVGVDPFCAKAYIRFFSASHVGFVSFFYHPTELNERNIGSKCWAEYTAAGVVSCEFFLKFLLLTLVIRNHKNKISTIWSNICASLRHAALSLSLSRARVVYLFLNAFSLWLFRFFSSGSIFAFAHCFTLLHIGAGFVAILEQSVGA